MTGINAKAASVRFENVSKVYGGKVKAAFNSARACSSAFA